MAASRDLDRERATTNSAATGELSRGPDGKSRSKKAINTVKADSIDRPIKQVDQVNHGDLLRNGKMNVQTAYGNHHAHYTTYGSTGQ